MKQSRRHRRGFTLIEAVISTLVVSILLMAAMGAVRSARATQVSLALRSRGAALGQALMSEILTQAYADSAPGEVLGPEAGETAATRAAFDDVDDYHRLDEPTPLTRGGDALDSTGKWRRLTAVAWVDPADPTRESASETGVKRITVEVSFGGKPIATLVSLRSRYP